MKPSSGIIAVFLLISSSCNPSTPAIRAKSFSLEYTAAVKPWMANVYECSGSNEFTAKQLAVDLLDPLSVDLVIRLGQPEGLTSPAYQIGMETVLVIVNLLNPVNFLTSEQVRAIFTGEIMNWQAINTSSISAPIQVWVFSSSEDVQQIFHQAVLGGSPVTSTAHLAVSLDEMANAITSDINAVGILTQHWEKTNLSGVYSVATVPVLAIPSGEPQYLVHSLIACLQK
jgi:hypothetical protein